MIHHYNRWAFIILVLFTVPLYHFLFSRYLDLTEHHFSSYFGFEQFVQSWTADTVKWGDCLIFKQPIPKK